MADIVFALGERCSLTTREGALVADIEPNEIVAGHNLIAKLDFAPESEPNREAAQLLRELDEAAFDLALAVMANLEDQLTRLGIILLVNDRALTLGEDFSGLVITEACRQIAFKFRSQHTLVLR